MGETKLARQVKKGLDFFYLDCNIFASNSALKPLIRRFKSDGLALYMHILCDVYAQGYYFKPNYYDDYLLELADDLNMSEDNVQAILDFLCDRALLDAGCLKEGAFTSHEIQEHYVEAMKGRKKAVADIKGDYWLLTESDEERLDNFYDSAKKENKSENNSEKCENVKNKSEINGDKSEINATNKIKENKIKEEKNKENKIKDFDVDRDADDGDEGNKLFNDFCNEFGVKVDEASPLIADLDVEKLQTAYLNSKKFLQVHPLAKKISWVLKNYASIISGKYADRPDKSPATVNAGGIVNYDSTLDNGGSGDQGICDCTFDSYEYSGNTQVGTFTNKGSAGGGSFANRGSGYVNSGGARGGGNERKSKHEQANEVYARLYNKLKAEEG